MRKNLPVSGIEYPLAEGQAIVSKTDLKGRITYVNPYFIEVSGFSEEELLGAPHNLVRHPDMPPVAFHDLWSSLQSGQQWTGMVKNRRKNGDFYWVRASVTPILDGGRVTGYLSIRNKPAREQVKLAEQAYASIRAGNPQRLAIRQGQTVRAGLLGRLTNLSLRARAMTALGSLATMFLGMGAGGYCLLEGGVAQGFGAAGLIGALAVLLLERSIAHSVGAPLEQATQAARAIAGGDLGNPILSERRDDMGNLLRSMEQMRLNLVAIIDDVHHSVDGIAVATREIALGNADLAQRTQRQASRLEETTDSMGQLAAAVQQNAGSAQEVSGLVVDATGTAQAGGVAVDKVRVTMEGIGVVGRRIEEIIGMIDAIAFQTNLLALNAAVEAAKAGEAGRGFAVVASEVRSLAQRSGHASKQIRNLLQDTIAQLEQGNRQVADASQTMRAIEAAVQQVNALMGDMAGASREQSLGIGEVNRTVVEMDANTQQNAAMVEQVAAAAGSLDEQAGRLMQAVSIFKLGRQVRGGELTPAVPQRMQLTHLRIT